MAHTEQMLINGILTNVRVFDKPAQEIDNAVDIANGAVRYDTAQTLTTTQQAQARTNINAAPDGHGLGGGGKPISSWDDIRENGWYSGPAPAGIGTGNLWGRVDSLSDGYAVQTIYSDTYLATAQRFFIAPTWQPWEWVNPPMQLGVEYRTTERYKGKPVYIKAVDTGALPNATYKTVTVSFPNANAIVDYGGEAYQDGSHFIPLPCQRYGTDYYNTERGVQVTIANSYSIVISTAADFSSFTSSSVWVKYTKSTD